MEKKREGDREAAGDGFIPYIATCFYWGGDREVAEVTLTMYDY
jgi:hypothetical protein